MATADAAKKKVNLSATVGVETATIAELKDAAKFVAAPDSATVSIGNVGMQYGSDGQPVEGSLPFSITFSWSEDR